MCSGRCPGRWNPLLCWFTPVTIWLSRTSTIHQQEYNNEIEDFHSLSRGLTAFRAQLRTNTTTPTTIGPACAQAWRRNGRPHKNTPCPSYGDDGTAHGNADERNASGQVVEKCGNRAAITGQRRPIATARKDFSGSSAAADRFACLVGKGRGCA